MNNTGERNADMMLKDLKRLTREGRGFARERVTGRKARGPHMKDWLQVSDTFLFSLKRQKETTCVRFYSPSLYKIKRRCPLKFCVAMTALGST